MGRSNRDTAPLPDATHPGGGPHSCTPLVALLAALTVLSCPAGAAVSEDEKLVPGDGSAGDEFGVAVAVQGNVSVVGAWRTDPLDRNSAGSVYAFSRAAGGGEWVQTQKITAEDLQGSDFFGGSISLWGDTLAVGAYQEDPGGQINSGAAYLFESADGGATWSQTHKLTASPQTGGDHFGVSVALWNKTLAIGAEQEDVAAQDGGAVLVFMEVGGTWQQAHTLTADDAGQDDRFGRTVAVFADIIAVGAYFNDAGGLSNAGAVYVFVPEAGGPTVGWRQTEKLAVAVPSKRLGTSLALSGRVLIAGASVENVDAVRDAGAAYIFMTEDDGESWSEPFQLTAATLEVWARFGSAVAVSDGRVIVGAPSRGNVGSVDAGSAYVFDSRDGGETWMQVAKLTASDGVPEAAVGSSVALDGPQAFVGALDWSEATPGAVYLADFGPVPSLDVVLPNITSVAPLEYFSNFATGATIDFAGPIWNPDGVEVALVPLLGDQAHGTPVAAAGDAPPGTSTLEVVFPQTAPGQYSLFLSIAGADNATFTRPVHVLPPVQLQCGDPPRLHTNTSLAVSVDPVLPPEPLDVTCELVSGGTTVAVVVGTPTAPSVIECVVPDLESGEVTVRVNATAEHDTLSSPFCPHTIAPRPTVSSVSPLRAPSHRPVLATITGTDLEDGPAAGCEFGTTRAPLSAFVPPDQFVCVVNATFLGPAPVRVTTNGQDYSTSLGIVQTFVDPTVRIVSAAPLQGPANYGGAVSLTVDVDEDLYMFLEIRLGNVSLDFAVVADGALEVIVPDLPPASYALSASLGVHETPFVLPVVVLDDAVLNGTTSRVLPGETLTLTGSALPVWWAPSATCRFLVGGFESLSTVAVLHSATEASCTVPFDPAWPFLPAQDVAVALLIARGDSRPDLVLPMPQTVTVSPLPIISGAFPEVLSTATEQTVTVIGEYFADTESTRCRLSQGEVAEFFSPSSVRLDGRQLECRIRWPSNAAGVGLSVTMDGERFSESVELLFQPAPSELVVVVQPPAEYAGFFEGGGVMRRGTSGPRVFVSDPFGTPAFVEEDTQIQATLEAVHGCSQDELSIVGDSSPAVNQTTATASFDNLLVVGCHGAEVRLRFEVSTVSGRLSVLSDPFLISLCPPPKISDPEDRKLCTCDVGMSPDGKGLCVPCSVGSYKEAIGAGGCTECGPGLDTAGPGATNASECVCAVGTYLHIETEVCTACPATGAECRGDGAVLASAGYWLEMHDGEPHLFECVADGRCRGNNTCGDGYSGLVCGVCDAGYGQVGEFCVKCPPRDANVAFVAVVLVVGIILVGALVATATMSGSDVSISLKVLLNYLQVLSLFSQFSAGWPATVAGAMGLASVLVPTSQTMSFDCAFGVGVYDRFLAAMLIPVAAIVCLGALLLVGCGLGWPRERQARCAAYALFFLYLVHPSVMQATLSVLQCRSFQPIGSFVATQLSLSCDSPTHEVYSILAILWLVVYCIGMLPAAVVAVQRNAVAVAFLRDGYREQTRHWEIVTMGRKLLVMLVATVVPGGSSQLLFGMLVLLVALMANSRFEPFSSRGISSLEDASLFTLLVTLSVAITFRDPATSATYESTLAWLTILFNAGFVAAYIAFVVRKLGAGAQPEGSKQTPLRHLTRPLRSTSDSSQSSVSSVGGV